MQNKQLLLDLLSYNKQITDDITVIRKIVAPSTFGYSEIVKLDNRVKANTELIKERLESAVNSADREILGDSTKLVRIHSPIYEGDFMVDFVPRGVVVAVEDIGKFNRPFTMLYGCPMDITKEIYDEAFGIKKE